MSVSPSGSKGAKNGLRVDEAARDDVNEWCGCDAFRCRRRCIECGRCIPPLLPPLTRCVDDDSGDGIERREAVAEAARGDEEERLEKRPPPWAAVGGNEEVVPDELRVCERIGRGKVLHARGRG